MSQHVIMHVRKRDSRAPRSAWTRTEMLTSGSRLGRPSIVATTVLRQRGIYGCNACFDGIQCQRRKQARPRPRAVANRCITTITNSSCASLFIKPHQQGNQCLMRHMPLMQTLPRVLNVQCMLRLEPDPKRWRAATLLIMRQRQRPHHQLYH